MVIVSDHERINGKICEKDIGIRELRPGVEGKGKGEIGSREGDLIEVSGVIERQRRVAGEVEFPKLWGEGRSPNSHLDA